MSALVGVAIGTFGDRLEWGNYARRAMLSVSRQTVPVAACHHTHGDSLHEARNHAAETIASECKWLIFLDADDELDERYVEAMLQGEGDIRRPSTLGVYDDGSEDAAAVMIPRTDLRTSNCIVIGAMCRASYFFNAGGFHNFPILEDWDLWQRMVLMGAELSEVPDAIYRVHVRDGSRNQESSHGEIYGRIRRTHADAWKAHSS